MTLQEKTYLLLIENIRCRFLYCRKRKVQATGFTAKQLSERFGKIMQDWESISINRNDTTISNSKQLESAILH
jgi:hypothetical protein